MITKLAPHMVLIKDSNVEEVTKGGICLPTMNLEKYQLAQTEGTILAMADDAFSNWDEKSKPQVGDVIYFNKYDGYGKVFGKVNYRFVSDDCVLFTTKEYLDINKSLEEQNGF